LYWLKSDFFAVINDLVPRVSLIPIPWNPPGAFQGVGGRETLAMRLGG